MAYDVLTQNQLAQAYKNALKAYNVQIDIDSTGTYWDVTANATGASVKEAVDWIQQVTNGNIPSSANSYMLELWATDLSLTPRKTGTFASGLVYITASSYPVTIPPNTTFSIVTLNYATTQTYTLNSAGYINVVADKVGAEYNISNQVNMTNSMSVTAKSQGFYGGSGDETDSQLLNRILLNISNRKTDGMLSDYLQRALEIYPYAETKTRFAGTASPEVVIPYGVTITLANTIQDYETAVSNSYINQIGLSEDEVKDAQNLFYNYSIVTGTVVVDTITTQVVTNLICYVDTEGVELTTSQIDNIRKAVRLSLLQFSGEYLTSKSLTTIMPDYVIDYYFNNFNPILKTSPLMDSINIGVVVL